MVIVIVIIMKITVMIKIQIVSQSVFVLFACTCRYRSMYDFLRPDERMEAERWLCRLAHKAGERGNSTAATTLAQFKAWRSPNFLTSLEILVSGTYQLSMELNG